MRVTAVSYLNTKPFIYGLYRSELAGSIDLSIDIPSICAKKLQSGKVDIALAPVAIIPELPEAYLVSDFCIGAVGPVKTVCLFSETPLDQIKQVYLDFHSRTSVALIQLLCSKYWQIQVEFLPAREGFEKQIQGQTAGLVIGDRAIGLERQFPYVYDLGEAWLQWTGMPFVFAAWISTKPIDPALLVRFNEALLFGLDHLPELLKILPNIPGFDLDRYFKENISYTLDEAKWLGLQHFLTYLSGEKGYTLKR